MSKGYLLQKFDWVKPVYLIINKMISSFLPSWQSCLVEMQLWFLSGLGCYFSGIEKYWLKILPCYDGKIPSWKSLSLGQIRKMGLESVFLVQLWEAVCLVQNEPKKLAYVETLYLSHMFWGLQKKQTAPWLQLQGQEISCQPQWQFSWLGPQIVGNNVVK